MSKEKVTGGISIAASASKQSSKLLSTHGKKLLAELSKQTPELEVIRECLSKDSLSGRVKNTETGENAFHVLIRSGNPQEFIAAALEYLVRYCPEGAKGLDSNNDLPLHASLCQNIIYDDVVQSLLSGKSL